MMRSIMGVFFLYLTALTVVACASCFSAAIRTEERGEGNALEVVESIDGGAEETEVMARPEESEALDRYCLRLIDEGAADMVGVYDADGILLRRVELPLAVLPEEDMVRLREGIKVKNEIALAALIIDFGG